MKKLKVILSGGGTGGHTVAEALERKYGTGVEILFVGAEGKMEMERIPALGYRIVGLPVAGLQRKLSLKNLSLPFKVLKSLGRAKKIIREFRPDRRRVHFLRTNRIPGRRKLTVKMFFS